MSELIIQFLSSSCTQSQITNESPYDPKLTRFTLPPTTQRKLLHSPIVKPDLKSIETYPALYTYTPKIGVKSRRLANNLNTTFQERQNLHLVNRDKFYESEQESILTNLKSFEKTYKSDPTKPTVLFTKVLPFTRSFTTPKKQTTTSTSPPIPHLEPEVILPPTYVKIERPKSLHSSICKDSKKIPSHSNPEKTRVSYHSSKSADKLTVLKTRANRALNNKNIFKVKGPYNIIRRELRKRGWIEQDYEPKHSKEKTKTTTKGDDDTDSSCTDYDTDPDCASDEEDYCAVTRIVRNAMPNFIITLRSGDAEFKVLTKSQIANHFRKTGCFTTKSGLTQIVQDLTWYSETHPLQFFPRCFLLSTADDLPAFIQEYLKTAAVSLLKDLKNSIENNTFKSIESSATQITFSAVKFAVNVCNEVLKSLLHDDVDDITPTPCFDENSPSWKMLLEVSYRLKTQQVTWEDNCKSLQQEITALLTALRKVMPQYDMDGSCNIWIVKPGAMSRGRGIKCLSRLDAILEAVSSRVLLKDGKYVVQKYIENPLLIERTKFDIRQWFLITDWAPVTVWMYRECYVRFSGQQFSLENFHESIHLCNNSIQKNYSVSKHRSSRLPADNICDLDEFGRYLIEMTGSDVWEESLFERAQKILFSVMLSSSPNIESHKGSFELYGADFMISDDLQLYLLEINSSPTMARNTQVTKRLCKQVQEDTIRFVIDCKTSKQEAEKCNWILAGKGPRVNLQTPPYGAWNDMIVFGRRIIAPLRFS